MNEETAIGVDLVEVDRLTRLLLRWPRLLERVFTEAELTACLGSRNRDERLAARFAAKEAAFKALGEGWPSVGYGEVEVLTRDGGAPAVSLSGRAAALAGRRAVALSLSHAGGLAMAGVVIAPAEEE